MHAEPVLTIVIATVVLLLAAAIVAIGLRPIRLPFTVGLVLVGMGLGLLAGHVEVLRPLGEISLSPSLIMFVFLPTLIFESAYNLDGRLLSKNIGPVLVLAVPGLVITTLIVGAMLKYLTPLEWGPALIFGALIAATDPVAVIAIFKEVGAPKRLTVLVEGESLFNDATAIVLFRILLVVIAAGTLDAGTLAAGALDFAIVFLGGLAVGGVIGQLMVSSLRLAGDDPLIQVTLSTVVAYMAFIVADHYLHVSGVMATLAAGLVVSTYGATRFSPEVKSYLHQFWAYAAFAANSLIFILVGMTASLDLFRTSLVPILIAVAVVLVARAVVVYGLSPVMAWLFPRSGSTGLKYQTVLFWGGLKGAVALALVLSIPADFAQRDLLVTLALGVVLIILLVGGLTTGPLVHALGLDRPTLAERVASAQARLAAKQEAKDRLDRLDSTHYSSHLLRKADEAYSESMAEAEARVEELRTECEQRPQAMLEVLWSEAMTVEQKRYRTLFERRVVSEPVFRELEIAIDLQRDRLKRGELPGELPEAVPVEVRVAGWFVRGIERLAPRSRIVDRHRRRALAASHEHASAVKAAGGHVGRELDRLGRLIGADPATIARCRAVYEERAHKAAERLDSIAEIFPEYVQEVQRRTIQRIGLDSEVAAIEQLASVGGIPESAGRAARSEIEEARRKLARRSSLAALRTGPEELLKRVPMFEGLSAQDFGRVVGALVPRTTLAGETIIRQGERGDSLFLVARGVVAVLVTRDGGETVRVASLHAGDFFGEMALLTDEPRSATVMAATDCRLFELSRVDVYALCDACPGVRQALEVAAAERQGS